MNQQILNDISDKVDHISTKIDERFNHHDQRFEKHEKWEGDLLKRYSEDISNNAKLTADIRRDYDLHLMQHMNHKWHINTIWIILFVVSFFVLGLLAKVNFKIF